ncbi:MULTISPECIES: PQQ-binding-like beta-propeller repeat protein [Salinibaculum]|uniref:PQQ-binding-like beta-propeller repeat protein n=1 Tax=Salinibaculum TaxID=2732368 RepID=UPI0030CDEC2C
MEKRDPQRTGYQPQPGPRDGLVERWRRSAGPPNIVRPGVVVASGRVYTVGRYALRAVASADGSPEWVRRRRDQSLSLFPDEPPFEFLQSGPTVSGDRVYAVSGVTLSGRAAATGQSTWAFRTTSSFEYVLPVGNQVVIGCTLANDDQLVALDQSTGLRRWIQTAAEVPLAFAPAEDSGMDSALLLTGTSERDSGRLVGRDPSDGTVRWRTPSDRPLFDMFATPAVNQGRVYAGGPTLTAFNASDGSVVWQTEAPSITEPASPITDGQRVYVVRDGAAVAVDAATGENQWAVSVEEISPFVAPVIAAETLYLPGDSAVVALDTTNGSTRFRHSLSRSDGRIYGMASADGTLYARVGTSLRAYDAEEAER